MMQPDWTVLLLGGPSGSGKTAVAAAVTRMLGVPSLLVDDLRLAIERVTAPSHLPALHVFPGDAGVWTRPPEDLCDHLWRVGEVMAPAVEVVVRHHIAVRLPVVIEGDGILPALAARLIADSTLDGTVRAVLLAEADERALFENLRMRARGGAIDPLQAMTQARMNWLFGQRIDAEARRYGLLSVAARPWETVVERVLTAASAAPVTVPPPPPLPPPPDDGPDPMFEVWDVVSGTVVASFADEASALALVCDALWTYGDHHVITHLQLRSKRYGSYPLKGDTLRRRALGELRA